MEWGCGVGLSFTTLSPLPLCTSTTNVPTIHFELRISISIWTGNGQDAWIVLWELYVVLRLMKIENSKIRLEVRETFCFSSPIVSGYLLPACPCHEEPSSVYQGKEALPSFLLIFTEVARWTEGLAWEEYFTRGCVCVAMLGERRFFLDVLRHFSSNACQSGIASKKIIFTHIGEWNP